MVQSSEGSDENLWESGRDEAVAATIIVYSKRMCEIQPHPVSSGSRERLRHPPNIVQVSF